MLRSYLMVSMLLLGVGFMACGETQEKENSKAQKSGTEASKSTPGENTTDSQKSEKPDENQNTEESASSEEENQNQAEGSESKSLKGFKVPESVIWDNDNQIWWVSNLGDPPSNKMETPVTKDGNGIISMIQNNSAVINHTNLGLNAPKGLLLMAGSLYVTDIDRVVRFELPELDQPQEISFADQKVQFLNDITQDPDGNVYVSCTNTNRVFKMQGESIEEFAEIDGPNGVTFANGKLHVISMNSAKISLVDGEGKVTESEMAITSTGDGLTFINKNEYLASSWMDGQVFHVKQSETTPLFQQFDNAAEFGVRDLGNGKWEVAIPTFFGNTVEIRHFEA